MNTFALPHLICQLSQRIEHKVRPENFVRMIGGIEQALGYADGPNAKSYEVMPAMQERIDQA